MLCCCLYSFDIVLLIVFFFFSSRRRHTRYWRDWSSDVCSSDLELPTPGEGHLLRGVERCVQDPDCQQAPAGRLKGLTQQIPEEGSHDRQHDDPEDHAPPCPPSRELEGQVHGDEQRGGAQRAAEHPVLFRQPALNEPAP